MWHEGSALHYPVSFIVVRWLSGCGVWAPAVAARGILVSHGHQTCVSPIARGSFLALDLREVPWTNKKNTERVPCWSVEEADYSHFLYSFKSHTTI